jgi:hypothetical protein
MCAMYGCPVDSTADPIEPSSRSFRVTAFQRRLAVIGRLPFTTAVVGAEDISPSSISKWVPISLFPDQRPGNPREKTKN